MFWGRHIVGPMRKDMIAEFISRENRNWKKRKAFCLKFLSKKQNLQGEECSRLDGCSLCASKSCKSCHFDSYHILLYKSEFDFHYHSASYKLIFQKKPLSNRHLVSSVLISLMSWVLPVCSMNELLGIIARTTIITTTSIPLSVPLNICLILEIWNCISNRLYMWPI